MRSESGGLRRAAVRAIGRLERPGSPRNCSIWWRPTRIRMCAPKPPTPWHRRCGRDGRSSAPGRSRCSSPASTRETEPGAAAAMARAPGADSPGRRRRARPALRRCSRHMGCDWRPPSPRRLGIARGAFFPPARHGPRVRRIRPRHPGARSRCDVSRFLCPPSPDRPFGATIDRHRPRRCPDRAPRGRPRPGCATRVHGLGRRPGRRRGGILAPARRSERASPTPPPRCASRRCRDGAGASNRPRDVRPSLRRHRAATGWTTPATRWHWRPSAPSMARAPIRPGCLDPHRTGGHARRDTDPLACAGTGVGWARPHRSRGRGRRVAAVRRPRQSLRAGASCDGGGSGGRSADPRHPGHGPRRQRA